MDPASIAIIAGIFGLLIERMFAWAGKIKKSSCCDMEIERQLSPKHEHHEQPQPSDK